MDALRDWGHAKDYVRMQWLMLQQDNPRDYVIATGKQISVREFTRLSALELGIELEFVGSGVDEVARVKSIIDPEKCPALSEGQTIVKVDPAYFRPAEVETLLGDPTLAKNELGWEPEISVNEMIKEMVEHDLESAKKTMLLKQSGFKVTTPRE